MKIAVIGTGYVGLVTGACIADMGNRVTCVDNKQDIVDKLNAGKATIYEPGLDSILQRNQRNQSALSGQRRSAPRQQPARSQERCCQLQ